MSRRFPFGFKSDENGGVLVTFAIIFSVLLALAGGAVDFAKARSAEAKLQMAADLAALAGANDPYQPEGQARTTAMRFFESARTSLVRDVKPTYEISSNATSNGLSVTVGALATMDTGLLRAVGIKTLQVSVTATAERPSNAVDIYAFIDMSASMGIAADQANRDRLVELTKPISTDGRGCAFACHYFDPVVPVPDVTMYGFAKRNGIRLREDVMKDAFGSFVDEMFNPAVNITTTSQRRISTYGFSYELNKLADLSKDPSTVKKSLTLFPDLKRIATNYTDVMPMIASAVGESGRGSVNSPRKMALLVTDGVEWRYWGLGKRNGAFQQSYCDALKKNGVQVAVLNVKYHEDMTDTLWYIPYVKPFYDAISPGLKGCASPGMYFEVSDSADDQIKTAFAEVAKAMKPKLILNLTR